MGILASAGVEDAAIDAWLLAEFQLGINKQKFYMNTGMNISQMQYDEYMEKVMWRSQRIPLQHITGTQEFMGMEFIVNEHVLIPRQDTELLVEKAIIAANELKQHEGNANKKIKILDMCTGSGCIAISLAKLCENVQVTAVDISDNALMVARENANKHELTDKITFVQSDLFENINDKYDLIVSNPPYIPTKVIRELEEEVKTHEPMIALDGNEDGLDFYNKITAQAMDYLEDCSFIIYEIGYDQGEEVSSMLRNIYPCVKVYKDLAGNDRVVVSGKEEL